ncbi:UDP-xylose and udp-n-acetylglucosamine transporter [Plakobranchus ocellatus]|uniref:UDP-xylose and udp-n-acetylglucosamine transporter n=1 Tax=Plakobranchus ocellatus TaxID=259542 RepID=A0AAV4B7I5_9GAST|nr:UDP-xylose and udp-n-acetylglucosamine transporter [Plakobranchus ocellatus]
MASDTGDAAYDYLMWLTATWLLKCLMKPFPLKYGVTVLHFLPLPGFLLLYSDISRCLGELSASDPYMLPVVGFSVPWACLWLLLNTLTQFICIRSVFILTTECTSLTVTLVVTLRKFISLVFSIVYFRNTFTSAHWVGAALVFFGTLMFVEVFSYFETYRRFEAYISGDAKKVTQEEKKKE